MRTTTDTGLRDLSEAALDLAEAAESGQVAEVERTAAPVEHALRLLRRPRACPRPPRCTDPAEWVQGYRAAMGVH